MNILHSMALEDLNIDTVRLATHAQKETKKLLEISLFKKIIKTISLNSEYLA